MKIVEIVNIYIAVFFFVFCTIIFFSFFKMKRKLKKESKKVPYFILFLLYIFNLIFELSILLSRFVLMLCICGFFFSKFCGQAAPEQQRLDDAIGFLRDHAEVSNI